MNFDDLSEEDRTLVYDMLMQQVRDYMRDESFLLAYSTKHVSNRAYYDKRIEKSRQGAIVWRAAIAKLQSKA